MATLIRSRTLLRPFAVVAAAGLGLAPLAAAHANPNANTVANSVAQPSLAPALPPRTPLRAAPRLALPAEPPAVAQPLLQSQVSCPSLQQRIAAVVGGETWAWSISVADPTGRLLADLNGNQPRVPASNQKLISTAFALDRLGPDHRLTTQLWRLSDGTLRLTGQGDPDLALPQLQRFARLAIGSGGGPGLQSASVRVQLAEEPAEAWWPQGWNPADRAYAYGAPITRLALTSNAIDDAVSNPAARLRTLMQRAISQEGGQARLELVSARAPLPTDAVLLHEEPSVDMHGLLSLANTESHNFTAEVLLRSAAGTWDLAEARRLSTAWLSQQGLPMQGVRVADGSGLDRSNRLTSRFLAALLLRMDQHPFSRDYLASMAVAGKRGTLRNLYKGTSLDGQLFAKTGTLTGVRSISGVLQTAAGPRYVSAISNGAAEPNRTIGQVLRQVQNTSLCAP
jgi:D-alanyl-D-alanine carboxypeptidase/D-alanyl-D-alanine-endopeptidase (penicillin-binding protein 4)